MSEERRSIMGSYFRQQRRLADLSMRQVSTMVGISNPYLSQIERGLRAPSEAVAAGIATALGISLDEFHAQVDPDAPDDVPAGVLKAISEADELTEAQQVSLAEIYRSFVRANEPRQTKGEQTSSDVTPARPVDDEQSDDADESDTRRD